MASTVKAASVSSHRVIGESRPAMLKVALPKRENAEFQAQNGACLDYSRRSVGWTIEQLAAELHRDPKQIARWIRGEENTQLHVVFGVQPLRGPFVIALAQLADCEVVTTISVKRSA